MAKVESLQRDGASIQRITRELRWSPTTVARLIKEQAVSRTSIHELLIISRENEIPKTRFPNLNPDAFS
jgi:hypothetical protein